MRIRRDDGFAFFVSVKTTCPHEWRTSGPSRNLNEIMNRGTTLSSRTTGLSYRNGSILMELILSPDQRPV
jgi:hypothetical protein